VVGFRCVLGDRSVRKTTRHLEQRTLAQLSPDELARREAARRALKFPPVCLTGLQALSVANGFASRSAKSGYAIWACAIIPEHTHLVIGRHTFKVEQMANLLKGAATTQLINDGRHPLAEFATDGKTPPGLWADKRWKVYLDSEQQIENAIAYVLDNPVKEGKNVQTRKWVTPFRGLEGGTYTV